MTGNALKDAFVLTYDRMLRYEGSWHVERQKLFPDYVFLESGDEKQFVREIAEYQEVFHVLGDDDGPIPLEPEEERFLEKLCGPGRHFGMSRGYILDGQTHVTEGPLLGRENLICRIDRHKRLARVAMPRKLPGTWRPENGRKTHLSRKEMEEIPLYGLESSAFKDRFREMTVGLEIVSKN